MFQFKKKKKNNRERNGMMMPNLYLWRSGWEFAFRSSRQEKLLSVYALLRLFLVVRYRFSRFDDNEEDTDLSSTDRCGRADVYSDRERTTAV
ncbi:hypothetical protein OUZ56_031634 [Daphnia magna]|uniref:Uncharacterized protein n=1 Tax=Daphnia magna TaxID=35525 RepID=A0ABQ9ZUR6_9CRUS|nr:hypothetical protein OUZ56_031634 [Daphnia magna]